MKKRYILSGLFIASAFAAFACASDEKPKTSSSVDYWSTKGGRCDTILKTPYANDLSDLVRCTKMWEMYSRVDDIPLKDRSMYAVAFSRVSYQATDPYDRAIADAALTRICIPRHPMGSNGEVREEIPDKLECSNTGISELSIKGTAVASSNPYEGRKGRVQLGEVSDRDAAGANASYKKATAERKKKNLHKAIPLYREALNQNPYHIGARYDLACALSLNGDEMGALRELEELYTYNDAEAEQRIIKARSDEDFEPIRDNPNFKLLTGYVRVAILNGASSIGEPTVAEMKRKLESKNIPVAEVGKSNRVELMPQIWYREGFDGYAFKIKEILGKNKMVVQTMKNNDSNNDVLIVWGQPEATAIGAGQAKPVVQGTRAKGSDNKLDDLVKEVEDTKNSVDHAQDVSNKLTTFK